MMAVMVMLYTTVLSTKIKKNADGWSGHGGGEAEGQWIYIYIYIYIGP